MVNKSFEQRIRRGRKKRKLKHWTFTDSNLALLGVCRCGSKLEEHVEPDRHCLFDPGCYAPPSAEVQYRGMLKLIRIAWDDVEEADNELPWTKSDYRYVYDSIAKRNPEEVWITLDIFEGFSSNKPGRTVTFRIKDGLAVLGRRLRIKPSTG